MKADLTMSIDCLAHKSSYLGSQTESNDVKTRQWNRAWGIQPARHASHVRSDRSRVFHCNVIPRQRREFAPVHQNDVEVSATEVRWNEQKQ